MFREDDSRIDEPFKYESADINLHLDRELFYLYVSMSWFLRDYID